MSEATTKAAPKKSKFFEIANRNFIMLFIAYTIICVAHSMTQATTSAGWKVVGLDMTVIGLISSVMGWAAFIIRPFSAPIVDRGNKKKIYLAAVALFTVAIFMYAQSMTNTAWAVPAKIIHGIAWTFISTVTAVTLSEYVSREDYGTALGFFMVSQMIASAISQPIAFELASRFGYHTMFLIFTGVAAVGLALVCLTAPTKTPERKGGSMFSGIKLNNLFAKEAVMPMLINVAYQGTRSGITVFMAAFALEELGLANIGLFATFASFTGWVARPFLGSLLDKKGAKITLIPAGISFALGLLSLALAQNLAMFCVAGILIGFGQNGISPVLMAISMRTVPEDRKAAGNSTNYLGMDIGSAIASAAGGFMVSTFGYRMGFAAFMVPVVLATVVAAWYLGKLEAKEKKTA
ncbi:MFS transporter [Cuneatibacter sp. NSJ-177]|uniref:MFS transporter n=1 Tax=Cuneatibacter sp. NSJ-177 TaxID=2931401 RepID=UPI001FCFA415|nr:MFS transporter [Cuneatibacter sp. NSJ-177]MCJ7834022.1 MFS transporter [Cuneatibacter sp. NSJ-177]